MCCKGKTLKFSLMHCHSPVLIIQSKTWSSFLSAMLNWRKNSNFFKLAVLQSNSLKRNYKGLIFTRWILKKLVACKTHRMIYFSMIFFFVKLITETSCHFHETHLLQRISILERMSRIRPWASSIWVMPTLAWFIKALLSDLALSTEPWYTSAY